MTTVYACPVCGKEAEVNEGEKVVHCRYCNSDFLTMEGEERYVMPAYYNSSSCFETFMLWAKKQGGYEESMPLELHMDSATLHFYPFWVISLEGTTIFSGLGEDAEYLWPDSGAYRQIKVFLRPEQGTFERRFEFMLPATKDLPQELKGYQIPGRARKYYSLSLVAEAGGKLHGAVIDRQRAEQWAQETAKAEFSHLISREVDRLDTRTDELKPIQSYYIYVPIWNYEYSFKGKSYKAFVDASTGRVIFATYPPDLREKASYFGVAVAHIVAGAALTAGLAGAGPLLYFLPFPLGLIGAGLAYAYRSLQPTRGGENLEE
jgi:DNA-directed RNA polymerase subunit RPC12/RpoP